MDGVSERTTTKESTDELRAVYSPQILCVQESKFDRRPTDAGMYEIIPADRTE